LPFLCRQGVAEHALPTTPVAAQKTMKPLQEDFPEIDDPVPAPEKVR
jgi:hypothetical protein